MDSLDWWNHLQEGKEYLFSFLFIDRVGSTKDSDYYGQEEAKERASLFRTIVEDNVKSFNGICIGWHGDATVGFFYASQPDPLSERAGILGKIVTDTAFAIYGELVTQEELKAYIALHIGILTFKKELGAIKSHDLDIGGHILKVCPEAGIILHEDLYRVIPEDLKARFRYLGTTKRDNSPVYLYPRQRRMDEKIRDNLIPESGDTHNLRERYLKFIMERHGKIVPRGLRQEKIISVDLLKIFSPLRLKRREETIGYPMPDIEEMKGERPYPHLRIGASSPPLSIGEVLNIDRHPVILGSPGAGKSTLILWIALVCAEGRFSIKEMPGLDDNPIPLPISVGHLSRIWSANNKVIGVIDAIIQYFRVIGPDITFIRSEIEKGRAILLFDGLDEIPSDIERREVAGWIEGFAQTYPENRIIITSRVIGFPGISLPQGEIYHIDDLTIDDARPLIEKWMVAIEEGLRGESETAERIAMDEAARLIRVLEETPQFSKFISNPFLLTLTILVHRTEAQLPNNRIQLFERMIQTLVETWHQARSISIHQPEPLKIDFRTEAIPVLAPLALWMHENFPAGRLREDELRGFIKERLEEIGATDQEVDTSLNGFLQRLKQGSGLLEEKGRDIWGFTHLSFEEYLSAVELVREEKHEEYLERYFYDPRWEEVLILCASELGITQSRTKAVTGYIRKILNGRGDEINEGILKRHILLAGRCMAGSANIERGLMEEITLQLIGLLFGGIKKLGEHVATVKVLAEMMLIPMIRDGVIRDGVMGRKGDEDPSVRASAISAISVLGIREEWAIEAIKDGVRDRYPLVRMFAISAIDILGIREEWAIEAAKEGIKDLSVRDSAYEA